MWTYVYLQPVSSGFHSGIGVLIMLAVIGITLYCCHSMNVIEYFRNFWITEIWESCHLQVRHSAAATQVLKLFLPGINAFLYSLRLDSSTPSPSFSSDCQLDCRSAIPFVLWNHIERIHGCRWMPASAFFNWSWEGVQVRSPLKLACSCFVKHWNRHSQGISRWFRRIIYSTWLGCDDYLDALAHTLALRLRLPLKEVCGLEVNQGTEAIVGSSATVKARLHSLREDRPGVWGFSALAWDSRPQLQRCAHDANCAHKYTKG